MKENFIEKAKKRHGNKYDYSSVVYTNSRTKITIICNSCKNIFTQAPSEHIRGRGCPACSKNRVKKESFIKRSNKIHNNKYDYSKVKYKNTKIKVILVCSIHGEFNISPEKHMSGQGCSKCGILKRSKSRIMSRNFINDANRIHNNKYTYSISKYKGVKSKINIFCKDHGKFSMMAGNHLAGHGCSKCGSLKAAKKQSAPFEEFVKRANKTHNNKYKYIKSGYKNIGSKTKIICKHHGEFMQNANSHLNGHGCPNCSHFISKPETEWLNSLNINKKYRNVLIKIKNKTFNVDAYDPKTNTVYEFYGDFWHGNPNKFNLHDTNPVNNKTFGNLYKSTIIRENIIKGAGFNMITIWEEDYLSCSFN